MVNGLGQEHEHRAACCVQGRAVMIVQFPHTTAGYTYAGTVSFIAIVDGTEVLCEISTEALDDHFGATQRASPMSPASLGRRRQHSARGRC